MLVVMLLAALRLWPPLRAQRLCRDRTVRTGKVSNVLQQANGKALYFSSDAPFLISHPCEEQTSLYLGKQLFLTQDNFESSLLPLVIPVDFLDGEPEVSSAHFTENKLLLVVTKKLYSYKYKEGSWKIAVGVHNPVSHISGENCCYVGNTLCTEVNSVVFVYWRGAELSQSTIYVSQDGGSDFDLFTRTQEVEHTGTLGGIFYFHSLSQIGLLLVEGEKGRFVYLDHPLNLSSALAFDYTGTLNVFVSPNQRGFLVLWNERDLLISPNSGQLVNSVHLEHGQKTTHQSISQANLSIHTIAATDAELAVLTKNSSVLYGSLEFLSSFVIKLPDQPLLSPETALIFLGTGMVEVLTPLPDPNFPAFDFKKCLLNIQAILMDPDLKVDHCKIELLEGQFSKEMHTIDMNSQLNLSAILIPRKGTAPIPLVMVSNPHSLGMDVWIYEVDHTMDGNTKFQLDIHLQQQHHHGWADPNFTSNIKRPTTSTVTLDIVNKEVSCVDMKPLSVLISVGCDLAKRIVVQNKVSACSKGILDPVVLQNNYSYIIEKEAYRPSFGQRRALRDQVVLYHYRSLGCPRLVYHETPWKPVIELWRGTEFQEIVSAEYVLREVHGLFTYSYSLTAGSAECIRQPQNWTVIMKDNEDNTWTRENYESCHDPNNPTPLMWPDVPYEILGGPTNNEIIFDERNGIYVFYLSIVDPYYSYCQLDTFFSVYVYGAYPMQTLPPGPTIMLLLTTILLALWLAYLVPKWLGTERCLPVRRRLQDVCARCRALCACRAA